MEAAPSGSFLSAFAYIFVFWNRDILQSGLFAQVLVQPLNGTFTGLTYNKAMRPGRLTQVASFRKISRLAQLHTNLFLKSQQSSRS